MLGHVIIYLTFKKKVILDKLIFLGVSTLKTLYLFSRAQCQKQNLAKRRNAVREKISLYDLRSLSRIHLQKSKNILVP